MREPLHWGRCSSHRVIRAHLGKGAAQGVWWGCANFAWNLYDDAIFFFFFFTYLKHGKMLLSLLHLITTFNFKICCILGGKGHYIRHMMRFSPYFEHFLWSLLRKKWPFHSDPPIRAATMKLFCGFHVVFLSAELAFFFSDLVDMFSSSPKIPMHWNSYGSGMIWITVVLFWLRILSGEPFFTPLIYLITSSFVDVYTNWKPLSEHTVNYSK